MKSVVLWNKLLWAAILGTGFVLEMLGIFHPADATLTQILKDAIPLPCRIMILSWLCWHFAVSDMITMIVVLVSKAKA